MIPVEERVRRRVRFYRNSRQCFLFGASWSHYGEWPERTVHVYLGVWLLTFTVPTKYDGPACDHCHHEVDHYAWCPSAHNDGEA